MDSAIPHRESSRYCGQYRSSLLPENVLQIFEDSVRIARTSRVPETAQARFELAVEAFHQLQAYEWHESRRGELERTMADLARKIPALIIINQTEGFLEQADRSAREATRRRHLERALECLDGAPPELDPVLRERREEVEDALLALDCPQPREGPAESDSVLAVSPRTVGDTAAIGADESSPELVSPPAARVEIEAGVLARVQPALVDNGFHVVHSLRLESRTLESLGGLVLRIEPEPAFAPPIEVAVAELAGEQVLHLPTVALPLSRGFFQRLSETCPGHLRLELTCDERVVGQTEVSLDLCPPGVWPGLEVYPEFLAAFVLPNDPTVQRVLGSACTFLAEWTGSPSLDGYQSGDKKRVLQMAAAAYAALQAEELTYANPPPNFAERGQRVRLPHEVLEHRMGTCLDLTLLYAACLEQIGLHPLLLVVEGHAFAGFWLSEESFTDPVVEEPLRLVNHLDLGDLAIVDPTTIASRPSIGFDPSREAARRHLADRDGFLCAIDVHRARKGQIHPLATLAPGEGLDEGSIETGVPATPTEAPGTAELEELERLRRSKGPTEAERPEDRLDRWCRKLLDLTMRNRLLNFRPGKKTVPLLCPDAGRLEDELSEGGVFRVLPRPSELDDDSGLLRPGLTRHDRVAAVQDLLAEDLDRRRVRADLIEEELDKRLVTLYREARTAVEEGGLSNLYLALGFLEYQETKGSKQTRRGPILLLPVELNRASARGGISLTLGGDQPHVNVTLLEYLRRDHALNVDGLDQLPEDQSGLDVRLILQRFREAIRGQGGWVVVDEQALGIFSFAKILIWNDLMNRHEELTENALVRHLVHTPNDPWDDGVEYPGAEDLDDGHAATEVLCPMSADSSQLVAVLAAAQGKNFVLQGPPGTGKSQTITNLIAHCLAEGKRVLFVSEKMAALEVVHARLREVGLSEACLELHSSKAKKKEVLGQLRVALDARARGTSAEWRRKAGELESLRKDLNRYVRVLHARHPSGESAFDALSRLTGLKDAPQVELGWPDVAGTTEEQLSNARRAVAGLIENAQRVDLRPDHPLLSIGRCEYSIQWDRDAQSALAVLADRLAILSETGKPLRQALGLSEHRLSWAAYSALIPLLTHLGDSPACLTEAMLEANGQELIARTTPWLSAGREATSLNVKLSSRYRTSPTALPLEDLERLEREAHTAWWLAAWSKRRRIRKAFRSMAARPSSISTSAALEDLRTARRLADLMADLSSSTHSAEQVFGEAWRIEESDWDDLQAAIDWTRAFDELAGSFEVAAAVRREDFRSACRSFLLEQGESETRLPFLEAWEVASAARRAAHDLMEIDSSSMRDTPGKDALQAEVELVSIWIERWKEINIWCSWRRARREASRCHIEVIAAGLEQNLFPVSGAMDAFERAYADAWYTSVSSSEPILAQFLGSEREQRILRFRQIDDEVMLLTREELRNRILTRGVTARDAPPSSEQGILQRELTKKRRHWALRRLFGEIPTLLPRLKPCMLMSPMSVAQYLDASREPFDLVVFDEASQIPVWDAIGAIARARQLVVVGDPKQLPPTSFFERGDDDDLEGDLVEDQESILDECLACRIPEHFLGWHYRSRHESLIEFSNNRYYHNRLVTFPACEDQDLGVSMRYVDDGVYDRGKSRTNRREADALVDEVVARLRDPRRAGRSIGVVTFNQTQQVLIQDLLDQKRREHPEIEPAFAEDNPEAVFVKNLENVQGDERDLILFSVGYGPDLAGRVRMEFGPLNRDGGERRLNVAITRAKREIVVFTSLKADQIDLGRTQARGVADLKLYLEFAEKGSEAFARELSAGGDVESQFEAEVLEALRNKGWVVHPQIGCSGYRIDLAVVDPSAPGRYLLGVECDGANYHSAKTARDRDKLRQAVLEGLGWHLHRVWSSDWWHAPERELEDIERALEDALRRRRVPSDPQVTEPDPPAEASETPTSSSGPVVDVSKAQQGTAPPPEPPGAPYVAAQLGSSRGCHEEFYEYRSTRSIGRAIEKLVQAEAPISLKAASRRVAALWGFNRVRKKAMERIEGVLTTLQLHREEDAGISFLWNDRSELETFETFRLPGQGKLSQRFPEEVHTLEFANAALHVLQQFGGMNEEDLIREVARLFGYGRVGSWVRERLTQSITRLVVEGRATRENGKVRAGRNQPGGG